MSEPAGILISDFDGTVTRRDFYDLVRERWPARPGEDPWEKYTSGELTHFAALAEIFSGIRASEAEMLALVDRMEIDAQFAPTVHALQASGWEVAISSAGCRWYIDNLLKQAGVAVVVHGNPGAFDSAHGLRMTLPERDRFFSAETGVDKIATVRDALDRCGIVAFAGDGRPDLDPSLLVPPERRFARGWLADALRERGEHFHLITGWSVISQKLSCTR